MRARRIYRPKPVLFGVGKPHRRRVTNIKIIVSHSPLILMSHPTVLSVGGPSRHRPVTKDRIRRVGYLGLTAIAPAQNKTLRKPTLAAHHQTAG